MIGLADFDETSIWSSTATPSTREDDPGRDALAKLGYVVAHHGTGGRNGVAIASRTPIEDVETNFGEPLQQPPGGDFNVAPTDADVWDARACHGGTHVSAPERAAFDRLVAWGVVDAYRLRHQEPGRYTWWDYRAGDFHRNVGMRIDHVLVTAPLARRGSSPRSTARRARASRSPRTMRRSS